MFTSKEQLIKRTGKNPVGRYDFLKLLATEYKTTKSKGKDISPKYYSQCDIYGEKNIRLKTVQLTEAKEQVLANLANFSYDPINYGYIRQLQIIDIFLHGLSEENPNLIRFAIGGICNLCLDSINKLYILRNEGIRLISSLLFSQDEEIIISAITSLMFLITPDNKKDITAEQIVERISGLVKSENNRIKNLATIFLNDYCQIVDKNESIIKT